MRNRLMTRAYKRGKERRIDSLSVFLLILFQVLICHSWRRTVLSQPRGFSLFLPLLLARPNARRGWWTDAQIQVLLFVRPFPSPLFSDFLTSDLDLRLTLAFGARSKGGQFLIRMTSTHEPTICSSADVQITEKYTLQKGPFSLPMRLCAKQHSSTISKSFQGN